MNNRVVALSVLEDLLFPAVESSEIAINVRASGHSYLSPRTSSSSISATDVVAADEKMAPSATDDAKNAAHVVAAAQEEAEDEDRGDDVAEPDVLAEATTTVEEMESAQRKRGRCKAVLMLPRLASKLGRRWTSAEVVPYLLRCIEEEDVELLFVVGLAIMGLARPVSSNAMATHDVHPGNNTAAKRRSKEELPASHPFLHLEELLPVVVALSEACGTTRAAPLRNFVAEVVLPHLCWGIGLEQSGPPLYGWEERYLRMPSWGLEGAGVGGSSAATRHSTAEDDEEDELLDANRGVEVDLSASLLHGNNNTQHLHLSGGGCSALADLVPCGQHHEHEWHVLLAYLCDDAADASRQWCRLSRAGEPPSPSPRAPRGTARLLHGATMELYGASYAADRSGTGAGDDDDGEDEDLLTDPCQLALHHRAMLAEMRTWLDHLVDEDEPNATSSSSCCGAEGGGGERVGSEEASRYSSADFSGPPSPQIMSSRPHLELSTYMQPAIRAGLGRCWAFTQHVLDALFTSAYPGAVAVGVAFCANLLHARRWVANMHGMRCAPEAAAAAMPWHLRVWRPVVPRSLTELRLLYHLGTRWHVGMAMAVAALPSSFTTNEAITADAMNAALRDVEITLTAQLQQHQLMDARGDVLGPGPWPCRRQHAATWDVALTTAAGGPEDVWRVLARVEGAATASPPLPSALPSPRLVRVAMLRAAPMLLLQMQDGATHVELLASVRRTARLLMRHLLPSAAGGNNNNNNYKNNNISNNYSPRAPCDEEEQPLASLDYETLEAVLDATHTCLVEVAVHLPPRLRHHKEHSSSCSGSSSTTEEVKEMVAAALDALAPLVRTAITVVLQYVSWKARWLGAIRLPTLVATWLFLLTRLSSAAVELATTSSSSSSTKDVGALSGDVLLICCRHFYRVVGWLKEVEDGDGPRSRPSLRRLVVGDVEAEVQAAAAHAVAAVCGHVVRAALQLAGDGAVVAATTEGQHLSACISAALRPFVEAVFPLVESAAATLITALSCSSAAHRVACVAAKAHVDLAIAINRVLHLLHRMEQEAGDTTKKENNNNNHEDDEVGDEAAWMRSVWWEQRRDDVAQALLTRLIATTTTTTAAEDCSTTAEVEAGASGRDEPPGVLAFALVAALTSVLLLNAQGPSASTTTDIPSKEAKQVMLESLGAVQKHPKWRFRARYAWLLSDLCVRCLMPRGGHGKSGRGGGAWRTNGGQRSSAAATAASPSAAWAHTHPLYRLAREELLPLLVQVLFDKVKAVREAALEATGCLCEQLRRRTQNMMGDGGLVMDVLWPLIDKAPAARETYLSRCALLHIAVRLRVEKEAVLLPLLDQLAHDGVLNVRLVVAKIIAGLLVGGSGEAAATSSGAQTSSSGLSFSVEEKNGVVVALLRHLMQDSSSDVRYEAAQALELCF